MAIVPISQPLAPGLLAADYSPWSTESKARSGLSGKTGIFDFSTPYSTGYTGYTPDIPVSWDTGSVSLPDYFKGGGGGGGGSGAGIPMPEVPGYKYVYPKYTYHDQDQQFWRDGYTQDKDAFDYYPYWPTGISGGGSILVGVELLKE